MCSLMTHGEARGARVAIFAWFALQREDIELQSWQSKCSKYKNNTCIYCVCMLSVCFKCCMLSEWVNVYVCEYVCVCVCVLSICCCVCACLCVCESTHSFTSLASFPFPSLLSARRTLSNAKTTYYILRIKIDKYFKSDYVKYIQWGSWRY